MIPTMILFGVLLGRWWRTALVLALVAWPIVVATQGVVPVGVELLGAAGFGVGNAAVGVLLHQAVLWIYRRLRVRSTKDR